MFPRMCVNNLVHCPFRAQTGTEKFFHVESADRLKRSEVPNQPVSIALETQDQDVSRKFQSREGACDRV